ncbi:hypothetical protein WJX74_000545 [Apatococcus lobatus]|uniref:TATA element modulatory factor 1 TATA binding domain-containing protein n=1 Tax=Apatococcus lobatus TaxID=904363 RepID=A0AAW1RBT0_9CHLO
MFGGFNISAGLTSLKDFNDKLTKMKEDMERNIETSLGLDGQAENVTSAATGSVKLESEATDGWDGENIILSDVHAPSAESVAAPQLPSISTAGQEATNHMHSSPDISSTQAAPSLEASGTSQSDMAVPELQQHHEAAELRSATEGSAMMLSVPEDADAVAAERQHAELPQPSWLQEHDGIDPAAADPKGPSAEGDLSEAGAGHESNPGSSSPAGLSSTDNAPDANMNLSAEERAAKFLVASVLERVTSLLDGPANMASMQEQAVHLSEEPAQMELQPQPQHSTPAHAVPEVPEQASLPAVDLTSLSQEQLQSMVQSLQEALDLQQKEVARAVREAGSMQQVMQALQRKNEELARSKAKVSEEDLETMRAEFEHRLAESTRKVYAITKERDALRRGSDKLSSVNELIKEKDSIIQQVMEEGEKLSKKQLTQETTIRKLRGQIREMEAEQSKLGLRISSEEGKLEAASRARTQAEADAARLREEHRAELEGQRVHYTGLLAKANSAQAEAEQKAAAAVKDGLGKQLREAQIRADTLQDTVQHLQEGMVRQSAYANAREDGLKQEVKDMESRCLRAEQRHADLVATMPSATQPLLRQLDALQAQSKSQAEAWQVAEARLQSRAQEAEAEAAAAAEHQRLAADKFTAVQSRLTAATAALDVARRQSSHAERDLERERQQRSSAEAEVRQLHMQLPQYEERAAELSTKVEGLKVSQASAAKACKAAESRAVEAERHVHSLEERLQSAGPLSNGHVEEAPPLRPRSAEPPAMAGPGYRWVLQREGVEEPSSPRESEVSMPQSPAASTRDSLLDGKVGGRGSAVQLERLRDALRQKEAHAISLRDQLASMEATRDRLAEELVAAVRSSEEGRTAQHELQRHQILLANTNVELAAAQQYIGEQSEEVEQLRTDLAEYRKNYHEQLLYFLDEREKLQPEPDAIVISSQGSQYQKLP